MEEEKHLTFRGFALFLVLLIFCVSDTVTTNGRYIIDTTPGVGRRFDGIGAISGGGVIFSILDQCCLAAGNMAEMYSPDWVISLN